MVAFGLQETMDALRGGIKAVAVGVSGSKPIPEDLVDPLIQVREKHDNNMTIFDVCGANISSYE